MKSAKKKRSSLTKAKTQRSHRTLAVTFGLFTVIFVLIIFYFAFSNTIITITPVPQPATVIFPLTVKKTIDEASTTAIAGVIVSQEATAEAELDSLDNEETIDGYAKGEITIINNWSGSQPLAATTRLLSSDNVLFRTDEFVEVPAGGQAVVAVTADQPGASGDITASKFTIPGLWTGLQDDIYGESKTTMTGGQVRQLVVTENNIEKLRATLGQSLISQARDDLIKLLADEETSYTISTNSIFADLTTERLSAEVGQPTDTLAGSATAEVLAIAYNIADLYQVIVDKLNLQFASGLLLEDFSEDNYSLALESYDKANQVATINVQASGTGTIDLNHDSFAPSRFTNMSRSDIIAYFSDFATVDSVAVKFSPFWVFRSPTLSDHIKIIIKE
ncbi:MAG: hypothetical protein V1838_01610 [Patescibacteria group bacterium]